MFIFLYLNAYSVLAANQTMRMSKYDVIVIKQEVLLYIYTAHSSFYKKICPKSSIQPSIIVAVYSN